MECNIFGKIDSGEIKNKDIKKYFFYILEKINQSRGELSVHFVNNQQIKKINHQFRGLNKVTDVISFAVQEGQAVGESEDLGDIFISWNQIIKQAKENNIDKQEELKRMLVHGLLHLLGYDHQKNNQKKVMFELQEKLIKEISKL